LRALGYHLVPLIGKKNPGNLFPWVVSVGGVKKGGGPSFFSLEIINLLDVYPP
jgi:hypothetical protein